MACEVVFGARAIVAIWSGSGLVYIACGSVGVGTLDEGRLVMK